ncbi:M90 family metallopeptidase [Povalibacter sp.]|uniref:M90 family metallopeptidase n=1 Tax=Povalibacter sp. TaxID=1962978 RepID=UPI002F3E3339
MPALILAITIVIGAIFWWLGLPALRARRRVAISLEPLPHAWQQWLRDDVPAYPRLPSTLQQRLHGLIQIFVRQKSFVGCNGLVVTERMKVVIAANACLLVLNRPGVPRENLYDDLLSILIYPTPFIVRENHRHASGLVSEGARVLSGQAWDSRRIILSWEDIEHAPSLGHNVVLHEFAHYLDMEDETMDGAPGLASPAEFREWSTIFWEEYDRLRANLQAGLPSLIDPYAATAPAEFFAVVTEVFFGRPHELDQQHPLLYQQLRKYYRLDPARWES